MLNIYRALLSPILFYALPTDPEWLQIQSIQLLHWLGNPQSRPWGNWLNRRLHQYLTINDPRLTVSLWGLTFPNPVGLGAGFDKNGLAANMWHNLGFGFAELGTVTWHPQPGNPRPRLFRLQQDLAALNRMGFNNQGAAGLEARLREAPNNSTIPLGINLGKSKITPLEIAHTDYLDSFKLLKNVGDYFVINVSSPNTPGLRTLQDGQFLSTIFDSLQQENQGKKPILVKIAPDLEWEAIESIIELVQSYQLAGIIATNTTISKDKLTLEYLPKTAKLIKEEPGGISGAPLRERSTEVIRFISQKTQGKLPIIGVGGIFTADDAWEKITAGASLIQVYTGWIYEGPTMVKTILQGLGEKLDKHNLSSIQQAVNLERQK